MFEQSRTTVAAAPIPSALVTLVEVARVGQVPRTSTRTGFSLIKPFEKFCSVFNYFASFASSYASNAPSSAFLYAFDEIVAPVTASTSE